MANTVKNGPWDGLGVITRGKGPGYKKWKRTHITVDTSKTHHLLLRGGKLTIPLKKKSMYLGTLLSYDQFERQSEELRVQAGWNNFKRLQPWLCRKHKISLQLRLELMRTCIIPTICYGIFFRWYATNWYSTCMPNITSHLQANCWQSSSLYQETHFTVLERFHIEPPLIVLHKLANQAHQSLTEALTLVHSHDVIHRINWSTLNATRTLLTSELCKPAAFPESDSEPEEVACICCAFIASSLPELQRHHTLLHDLPRPFIRQVDFRQDTTDGMPQCKHCKKMFLKSSSFKLHCRANVCGPIPIQSTVIPSQPIIEWGFVDPVVMEPGPLHNEYHDRAMVNAAEADYASARGDRKLRDYLQFHCVLCSRHLSHTKAITAHKKSNHPGQLQEAIALGIQRMICLHAVFANVSFNKTHLCPVFLQLAILELHAATPDDPLHFTCFLCQFVAADRQQLKKHLTTLHQFPCHDWTLARDSRFWGQFFLPV